MKYREFIIIGCLLINIQIVKSAIREKLPKCGTHACINVAAQLLNFMDTSADPCADFYQAACGKYIENHYFDEKDPLNGFKLIRKTIDSAVMMEFIEDFENSTLISEKVAGKYLKLCKRKMNDALEKTAIQQMTSYLTTEAEASSVESFIAKVSRKYGQNGLFEVGVQMIGPKNKLIVELSPPEFKEPMENYIKHVQKEKPEFVGTFKLLLEKLYKSATKNGKDETNVVTLDRSKFKWKRFFDDLHTNGSEMLQTAVLVNKEYFDKIETILASNQEMPLKRYSMMILDYHNRAEVDKHRQNCDKFILHDFTAVVGTHWIRKNLDKDNLYDANLGIRSIRKSLKTLIRESKWMDTRLKDETINKIDNISYYLGYSKILEETTYLEDEFKTLILPSEESIILYYAALKGWHFEGMINYILTDKPPLFVQPIHLSETKYLERSNVLGVSSLILQRPFIDFFYPSPYNFGSFGTIVAAQIAKVLSPTGKKLTIDGEQNDWWTNETDSKYDEAFSCYKQQYDSFKFEQIQKPASSDALYNELISEQIGLLTAYHSYKTYGEADRVIIPGVRKLTPDQIFFYRYAQRSCVPEPGLDSIETLSTSTIPFPKHLVNGALMNSKPFAEAFKCGSDTKMNPAKKCSFF